MAGTDFISGDWNYSENGHYTVAYAGEISGYWGGGCNFLTTKAVVERIVADQDDVIATFAPVDGTPDPCDWDTFTWDGDVLVQHGTDGEDYRHEPQSDGRYEVSFGWTWCSLEADDKLIGDIVHFDGTVEQRTN
jgi:hypothetical protein